MQSCLVEALHYHNPEASGYFAIRAYEHQHMYRLSELPSVLEHQPIPPDLMISQAEYYSPRNRKLVNVSRINSNFVDCDLHKSKNANVRPEQAARDIVRLCEDRGIPEPNLINHSGRGLHVKWLHKTPTPACALSRWKYVQRALAAHLEDYGADLGALDATRCLRAVGTLNNKAGVEARTLLADGGKCDFDTLANKLLLYTREEVVAFRQKMAENDALRATRRAATTEQGIIRQPSNLWQIPNLYCHRLADVRTLCEMRGWTPHGQEGYRNKVLLIATTCMFWAHRPPNLEAQAKELAWQLCRSFTPAEVQNTVWSLVTLAKTNPPNKKLRLRTQTIVDWLNITPREQRLLQTLYNADERKRRRHEYDAQRKWGEVDRETYLAQAQQRRAQAHTLREQGLKCKQVADCMGITLDAAKTLLRKQATPPTL